MKKQSKIVNSSLENISPFLRILQIITISGSVFGLSFWTPVFLIGILFLYSIFYTPPYSWIDGMVLIITPILVFWGFLGVFFSITSLILGWSLWETERHGYGLAVSLMNIIILAFPTIAIKDLIGASFLILLIFTILLIGVCIQILCFVSFFILNYQRASRRSRAASE